MKKIVIFGGTFNPIHNGHLNVAGAFYEYLKPDKLFFVPANIPPHKKGLDIVSSDDRLEMCRIAAEKYPGFEVSDLEIKRSGISYTVDTLKNFKSIYSDAELYIIVGADMFLSITEWKDYAQIFKLSSICVAPRDKFDVKVLEEQSKNLRPFGAVSIILDIPSVKISSGEIRKKIKRNEDCSELIPKAVEDYIKENKLYL